MTPVFKKYSQQLIAEGVATQEEVDAMSKTVLTEMNTRLDMSKEHKTVNKDDQWLTHTSPAAHSIHCPVPTDRRLTLCAPSYQPMGPHTHPPSLAI